MNCETTRRLIDRGIAPGSANSMRAEMGFHLAQCQACRAYHHRVQAHLLAVLLDASPVLPRLPPPASPLPPAAPHVRQNLSHRWKWLAAGTSAILLIAVLTIIVPALAALFSLHQSAQAMQMPPPAASAELAPVMAVVPVMASPSARSARATPTARRARLGTAAPTSRTPTPTARIVPTRTITPVPLDAILSASRPIIPSGNAPAAPARSAAPGAAMTVLLLGVDRRPSESGPTRADSILIARLDPARQRIALLSLPRDLIVPIPGYGQARINAANVYGELDPALGGGIALTRATVSNLLGLSIDHVVEVDFQGFTGAVDALGGIDLDVPTELYDPEYPTMDYGYTIAHFVPGMQHLDGARALMYARVRHGDSDFMRMRRQQSVLVGVLQRVRTQNMLQQLQSVANVTAAMRGYIRTDLSEDAMVNLAWSFRSLSPKAVERYTLDENAIQVGVLPDDPYAEFALPGAIEHLAHQLIDGP